MTDLISREKAIHKLRNALYKYEDENEEKYINNKKVDEWFDLVRPSVQDMNDLDVQTLVNLPSESPWHTDTPTEEGWYLVAFNYEDEEGVRYTTDYFKDGKWAFPMVRDISKVVKWQKIEEKEDGHTD